MEGSRPSEPSGHDAPRAPRVCHVSRRKGWLDPSAPRRPTSETNLLAVYLGSPVWTLGTAWESVFRTLIPLSVERAYRKATAHLALTEQDLETLRAVAERLGVRLEVHD